MKRVSKISAFLAILFLISCGDDGGECSGGGACAPIEDCTDGIDNDLNGATDCDDIQCQDHEACKDGSA